MGRIERVDARQLSERVGVFRVVEPAEHHAARVAGMGCGLCPEKAGQPGGDLLPLRVARLLGVLRRHLPIGNHICCPLPVADRRSHRRHLPRGREIHIPLEHIACMASVAVAGEQRHRCIISRSFAHHDRQGGRHRNRRQLHFRYQPVAHASTSRTTCPCTSVSR